MRIALLADIHANREAFDAVLSRIAARGYDRIVLLGDLVGYGPDPLYCVEKAHDLATKGAIVVLGNHDEAIENPTPDMNRLAMAAILWTREQLHAPHREFLRGIALSHSEEDRLYVHASARNPRGWEYVTDPTSAEGCLRATAAPLVFVGHVHVPALWRLALDGTACLHHPEAGIELPLSRSKNWLCVIGSVGQARDGLPAAAYALLDTDRRSLTFERAPYDHFAAARKLREAGLPLALAERLVRGV